VRPSEPDLLHPSFSGQVYVLGQIAPGADVAAGPEAEVGTSVVADPEAVVVTIVVAAGAEYEAEVGVGVDEAEGEKVALDGMYAPVTSVLEFRLARLLM
jgi:hypothetical protein